MFSALSQGSPIYIIDKTDGLKYKTGEVVGVVQGNPFGGTFGTTSFVPNGTVTLKVKYPSGRTYAEKDIEIKF